MVSSWVTHSWFAISGSPFLGGRRWTGLLLSHNTGIEIYRGWLSHWFSMMAEGKGNYVEIFWCIECRSEALVGLRKATWSGLFWNESIVPVADVHAWVMSDSSGGPICTNPAASAATNRIPFHFGRLFVCSGRRTRPGESFSMTITSRTLSLSLGASGMSLMVRIDSVLRRKMLFINLSMNEILSRSGFTKLCTAAEAFLTPESPVLTLPS